MYPETLAAAAQGVAKENGLKIEVFDFKEIRRRGMKLIDAVGRGSSHEPRFVHLSWTPKGAKRKLVFVGKGITFDSGGLSIKPAAGMGEMKHDMSGAANVIALMAAVAAIKPKVEVHAIAACAENMPDGNAYRPGDIWGSLDGKTVEIINTDAEGRLVLADVLWYAQQKFDPKFMVDLATLTGAIIVGLGHEYAGMFSNDDALSQRLSLAGQETGERVWRMPLDEAYDKLIKSEIADMKNIGGRPGGSITAAQFIQRFVNSKPWAHLDIAGTAWSTKDTAVAPKGATAFGVRLLDRLVASNYEA
jgi:leucyl aminopeptidase